MLEAPNRGFARSDNGEHNGEVSALAEWIEGCVTFSQKSISKIEIVDLLIESQFYDDEDFAKEWLTFGWQELERRARCLGSACPFSLKHERITAIKTWRATPAFSFCLMCALQLSYREHFRKDFGSDYTVQGELLERLTAESMEAIGWSSETVGWSGALSNSFPDKLARIAKHINEYHNVGAINRWANEAAKDGGLDVVCKMPFTDLWSGRPLLLVQCASGENWHEKRHTPSIELWGKLIDWSTKPTRGISIPFVLDKDDFRKKANFEGLSLVIDRHRLCAPKKGIRANWISGDLTKDLNTWTASRLKTLLKNRAG